MWPEALLLCALCGSLAADADTELSDSRRFQAYLHRHQYPVDCRDRPGVLTRAGMQPNGQMFNHDYFYGLGLGSQIVSLKFNFVMALLQGKIYHFPTSHYVNPLRCPSQSFDCYFARPTNCSLPVTSELAAPAGRPLAPREMHRKVDVMKLLWCFDLPRRRLSRLLGLAAVHSNAWYHGQLATFLFRPNDEMLAFRTEMLTAFDVNTSVSPRERWAGEISVHNGSCAAMHIRRTDKFKGRRREDRKTQIGFAGFAHSYKSWAYWQAPRPAQHVRVLLGSEDKATFGAMPPLLAPSVTYWIPGRYFVMGSFKDINDNNNRLMRTYARLQERMRDAQAAGGEAVAALVAAGAKKDEGMALVLQIIMMGECDALFGSYASNVAVLVHDLQHARQVARRQRMHAVDVNGRIYCGCGASFCMKVEKRAAREPRRGIRHMVDAFRGDNINAI